MLRLKFQLYWKVNLTKPVVVFSVKTQTQSLKVDFIQIINAISSVIITQKNIFGGYLRKAFIRNNSIVNYNCNPYIFYIQAAKVCSTLLLLHFKVVAVLLVFHKFKVECFKCLLSLSILFNWFFFYHYFTSGFLNFCEVKWDKQIL